MTDLGITYLFLQQSFLCLYKCMNIVVNHSASYLEFTFIGSEFMVKLILYI